MGRETIHLQRRVDGWRIGRKERGAFVDGQIEGPIMMEGFLGVTKVEGMEPAVAGETYVADNDEGNIVIEWNILTPFRSEEMSGFVVDEKLTNDNYYAATITKIICCGSDSYMIHGISVKNGNEVQLIKNGDNVYLC